MIGAPSGGCPFSFMVLSLNMGSLECPFSVGEPPRDLWTIFHLYVGPPDINPMFVLVIYRRKWNCTALGIPGTPFSVGMIGREV